MRPTRTGERYELGPGALTLLHVDTDLGSNPDDAFALAMLVGWPDADIAAVTTVDDPDGQRAGYVTHLLRLLGRNDVPVASGAAASGTTGQARGDLPSVDRHWGPVDRALSPRGAALGLLERSIDNGATVVAIGPFTNLADFERARPGRLSREAVFAMGGGTGQLDSGLPSWGPQRDTNVQYDTDAAATLLRCSPITWVPIHVTARTYLKATDLAPLRATGPVGRLLAAHAETYAADRDLAALGKRFARLPSNLVAFLHDPLTCAAALGWAGVSVEPVELQPVFEDGVLRFDKRPGGRPCHMVTAVDGSAFVDVWLAAVERAQQRFG
jgi:inosine-uridine nucleoside N-ribohydrolase